MTSAVPFVSPLKLRSPSPASLSTIYLRKVVRSSSGGEVKEEIKGGGTGFFYRRGGRIWLVTCWHVLTARRPDNPGMLLSGYPDSPVQLSASFPLSTAGQFSHPWSIDLYQDGKPIWRELRRAASGIDLAAIPIVFPAGAAGLAVNDRAPIFSDTLEVGFDVVITGYPVEQGPDCPYPIWKKAMIASEPRYSIMQTPQMLVDTPGNPGMSGSPVYASKLGISYSGPALPTSGTALDRIMAMQADKFGDDTVLLKLLGVYAGSTGAAQLETLSLGRLFAIDLVDKLIDEGEPGVNPFPPASL